MLVCPKCGSTYTRSLEFCGLDGDRLIESEIDPLVGRTIDRYEIVEAIGTGGMARVYRARHVFLEQDFAIKVLFGQIAADKSFARRFHREATTLGKIKHRNVVQVSDFGATKEGLLFLVMEYLDGPSLTEAIRRSAPFSPFRAAGIARQLALGLSAAHSRGFVHRDLKPGNVMLMEEDAVEVPKILDFGLVRLLEPEEERVPTQLTQHGQMFGTPAYMSPEQISGEEVDSRSDLYSLGVILYQMIVGTPPFVGEVGELVRQHVSVKPSAPALEYGGLTPIAMTLLQKHPIDRIQSATEVVDAIDRLGLITPPTQPPKKRSDSARTFASIDLDTRAERTPRIDSSVSVEIDASVRDALGFRAYWRWVLAIGLLGIIGFMVWVADQQGLLRRHALTAIGEPVTVVEPPAETTPPVEKKKKKKKKKKAVAGIPDAGLQPVPEARPEPESKPPPRRSPPVKVTETKPPPSEPKPIEPARPSATFEQLDESLGWNLSSRGLAWEDVAEVETEAAWRWTRWFKTQERGTEAEMSETYDQLLRAARGLEIDRELLADKLARAKI